MDNRIKNPAGWSKQLFANIVNMGYDSGFRGCTCEKNHCLTHYCECFAAGLFCVESCTCKDCRNVPENQAKVLERQKDIESRYLPWINLQFDHEVKQEINELPATKVPASTEDNNIAEAREEIASSKCQCKKNQCMKYSSGCFADRKHCTGNCGCQGCCNCPENEHKSVEARNAKKRIRGCRCLSSKCLGDKCGCHKKKVGCSESCECWGCGNRYGQKPKDNKDKNIR